MEEVKLLDNYSNVRIYRKGIDLVPTYEVDVPKFSDDDERIINLILEKAAAEIQIDPYCINSFRTRKEIFRNQVNKLIDSMGIYFSNDGELKKATAERVVQKMVGYGLIDFLLEDDNLEDIMVVGPNVPVYIYHRVHGMCRTNLVFKSNRDLSAICEKIAREVNGHLDFASPTLEAHLADGSRATVVIPPLTRYTQISIRKFLKSPYSIVDLIERNTLDSETAALLWIVTEFGRNCIIIGAPAAGKTTLMSILASFIPKLEHVVTIEDTSELKLPHENWVPLYTRPPNIEGKGEVKADHLLSITLRMRPDRILIGEIREEETRMLFAAMNAGQISGCFGTMHARSSNEVIPRLIGPPMNVEKGMIRALDLIISLEKIHNIEKGIEVRKVFEVSEVTPEKDGFEIKTLCEYDAKNNSFHLHTNKLASSKILHEIIHQNGLSSNYIQNELKNRKKILEYLQRNHIRDFQKVYEIIQAYYADPKKVIEAVISR
ncbi:MAG: ATPase, T2SS/T4P/T4SS family [Euryarchaeota archaeon]|nr:ATPase, T2SS/T4P/T4SS family [Euryarchaeota archaeon]